MDDTVERFETLLLEGADRDVRDLRALDPLAGTASWRPGWLVLYGHLCLLTGRTSVALRCYRNILELEPSHPGARLGRLVAIDQLGARTPYDTRMAESIFRSAGEADRRLLVPLASAPLRRAARIPAGPHLAAALERRVAGQAEGRARLVELVEGRVEGGREGRAPVAALVGPEGVGRTTAVRSIARALLREERVVHLKADEVPGPLAFERPVLVLVERLEEARAEDLSFTARLVGELARNPAVILVALRLHDSGCAGRRPVGFPGATLSAETLAGRLGAALASTVDAEVPFPALGEETARRAVQLAWRDRAWPLAAEAGGWENLDAPDLDAVFRAVWDGNGLPRLPEELSRAASRPGVRAGSPRDLAGRREDAP